MALDTNSSPVVLNLFESVCNPSKEITTILQDVSLILNLIKLNARPTLLRTFFPNVTSSKIKTLQVLIGKSNFFFPFENAASSISFGWASPKQGALTCNLIHAITKSIYPKFNFDEDLVTPSMLVNISISFNNRFGSEVGYVDVNLVNSFFHAITIFEIYPSKCLCNRFYLRTIQSSTSQCPWCRLGVAVPPAKSIKFDSNRVRSFHSFKNSRSINEIFPVANAPLQKAQVGN